MRTLGWTVEIDAFTDKTPYGEKHFANVVATKDPKAARRVILAAHFDSKFFATSPENQFLGATDSAAPCAMMLDLAEALDPLLDRREALKDTAADPSEVDHEDDVTLQLVFFDGEEAFKDWTHTDSVYGARHLAEKWQRAYIDPRQKRRLHPTATELSTIDHLVLLDLLGAARPHIRSYFQPTAWLFDAMASAERRVLDAGLLADVGGPSAWSASDAFFVPRTGNEYAGGIEDDHIPFLRRGVEILHIIASPFPNVWHTIRDDASALDLPTMRRWNLILRVFFSEYLGLRPDIPSTAGTTGARSSKVGRADEEL
ncbi:hypothetical protein EXIGLDRAFT_671319 [Exidia glandulosa HHB12029]|uniref:Peptide hydrolase n=1 Tax=Exidia glandulosa HHB12029 TaxID=1314781 RepID=A0A165KDB0_EXIGL|nr:hypothetical protein EXIGLDRAFT_671319 [Exidia glandulosa HHB12029]